MPYLFASLVYHYDWLRENLSDRHPLWNQPVFTYLRGINGADDATLMQSLRGRVLSGKSQCSITNLRASGIPPHLATATEIRTLNLRLHDIEDRGRYNVVPLVFR